MAAVESATVQQPQIDFSDRTSGIGTSLYIAPEVTISKSYNEKVPRQMKHGILADGSQADMYSLGIIVFEMCYQFKTAMERVQCLTAIRQPSITFPTAWPLGEKPNQREIINWLLRHNPINRPQAEQLLASQLLPSAEKQKDYYDTAIAGI